MAKDHLEVLRTDRKLSFGEQLALVVRLSIPAILAEITAIAMQYIDAAMVGSLGTNASAAIGLVSSTTWLMGGFCSALAAGFSVQVAHLVGAGREDRARCVMRQGLIFGVLFGLIMAVIGTAIAPGLPVWLGGEEVIHEWASSYFYIFAAAQPFTLCRILSSGYLQCSGDMRTPSLFNALACLWDVVFNFLLIFPTRTITLFGLSFTMPGAGLAVAGAALGTALSEVVTALCMLAVVCFRSPKLKLSLGGSWRLEGGCLATAARISVPMALERGVISSAYVAATKIVTPLGTVAVAANSLAVTAEGLCYMPGYGISAAATSLVGQSLGAKRTDLARGFARLTVLLAMVIMGCTGVLMYIFSPQVFSLLTPVPEVQSLGVACLRIELFAEPLFAASIVAAGALRGAGDTLVPSAMNLISMWGVRITMSLFLAPRFGLQGVWFAMCVELCFRGVLFLVRLFREKWLKCDLVEGSERA